MNEGYKIRMSRLVDKRLPVVPVYIVNQFLVRRYENLVAENLEFSGT